MVTTASTALKIIDIVVVTGAHVDAVPGSLFDTVLRPLTGTGAATSSGTPKPSVSVVESGVAGTSVAAPLKVAEIVPFPSANVVAVVGSTVPGPWRS